MGTIYVLYFSYGSYWSLYLHKSAFVGLCMPGILAFSGGHCVFGKTYSLCI